MGKRPFASTKLLLLTMLIISHLVVCLRDVPSTRIQRLAHKPLHVLPTRSSTRPASVAELETGSRWEEDDDNDDETGGGRRMGLQLNDYPGSGANNRHIPKPPNRK